MRENYTVPLTEKDKEIIDAVKVLEKHIPYMFKIYAIEIDESGGRIYYGPDTIDGPYSHWLVW